MSGFMVSLCSLSDLFNDTFFRIPDYQRGFAWQTQQLNDLWEDLLNLNDSRKHYTGILTLRELSAEEYIKFDDITIYSKITGGAKVKEVVDGQQRLTTFIILIKTILDVAEERGILFQGRKMDDIRTQFISKQLNDELSTSIYRFNYEKGSKSYSYMMYNIYGEETDSEINESYYSSNLKNAKDFFIKKVNLYCDLNSNRIELLYNSLVRKMMFNIYDIDDNFDVHVAFETMNNRGKKLSTLEILKNRLIYLTTIFPDDRLSETNKKVLRDRINDVWGEIYYQLGRGSNDPLIDDEYLQNHWNMFFKYVRKINFNYEKDLLNIRFTPNSILGKDNIYYNDVCFNEEEVIDEDEQDAITQNTVLEPKDINRYITSLGKCAQYWYYSFYPDDRSSKLTDEERLWMNRLNRVGINYFRPLVIASLINDNVSSADRVRLFRSIEKFIFLCFRMARYNSSYSNNSYYRFANRLLNDDVDIGTIIEDLESRFKFDLDEGVKTFKTKIVASNRNGGGFFKWSSIRYLLYEYEMHLSKEKKFVMSDWDEFTKPKAKWYTIEHIYPQKPTDPYWVEQFKDYDEKQSIRLLNTLGNLLPLNSSVNASMQNHDFKSKKKGVGRSRGYENGSYSEREVYSETDWNPQTIMERGLRILEFMEERWGIKFDDEEYKLEILGLSFMRQDNN